VSTGIFAEKDLSRARSRGRPRGPHVPAVTLDLALAVIASSAVPLLLLDGNLTIIVASASFALRLG
jgi:hypothetical protein